MSANSLYPRKPINYDTDPYDCFVTYRHKPTGKKRDKRNYTYIAYVRATSEESASSIGVRSFSLLHPNAIVVHVHASRTFPVQKTRWNVRASINSAATAS